MRAEDVVPVVGRGFAPAGAVVRAGALRARAPRATFSGRAARSDGLVRDAFMGIARCKLRSGASKALLLRVSAKPWSATRDRKLLPGVRAPLITVLTRRTAPARNPGVHKTIPRRRQSSCWSISALDRSRDEVRWHSREPRVACHAARRTARRRSSKLRDARASGVGLTETERASAPGARECIARTPANPIASRAALTTRPAPSARTGCPCWESVWGGRLSTEHLH